MLYYCLSLQCWKNLRFGLACKAFSSIRWVSKIWPQKGHLLLRYVHITLRSAIILRLHHNNNSGLVWHARLQAYQDSYSHELQEGTLFNGRSDRWIWQTTLPESCRFIEVGNDRNKAWALAIGKISKFVSKPSRKHFIAERVICYPEFARDYHLRYSRGRPGNCMVTVMHLGDAKMMVSQYLAEYMIEVRIFLTNWRRNPETLHQLCIQKTISGFRMLVSTFMTKLARKWDSRDPKVQDLVVPCK